MKEQNKYWDLEFWWYERCTKLSFKCKPNSREAMFWWSLRYLVKDLTNPSFSKEEVFNRWVGYLDYKLELHK